MKNKYRKPIHLTMPPMALALLLLAPFAGDAILASGDGGPPQMVDVIVTYDQTPGNSENARVRGLGSQVKHQYNHFKMMALRVPVTALHGLAQGNGVRSIVPDDPVMGLSLAAKQTANLPQPGSTYFVEADADIGVAVLDSGVAFHDDLPGTTHVDIIPAYTACNESSRDEFNAVSFTGDDGAQSFITDWLELDSAGAGPSIGNVIVADSEIRIKEAKLEVRLVDQECEMLG